MGKRRFRRGVIVDHSFQWRYLFSVLFTMVLSVVTTAFTVSWFFLFRTSLGVQAESNGSIIGVVLIISTALSLYILAKTLLYSQKVAGPVYKAGLVLKRAAEGEIPAQPLTFRKGDNFSDLAEAVNACLDRIRDLQEGEIELGLKLRGFEDERSRSQQGS